MPVPQGQHTMNTLYNIKAPATEVFLLLEMIHTISQGYGANFVHATLDITGPTTYLVRE